MRANERVSVVLSKLDEVLPSDKFELVIVFGSYGRGHPREDSDLDLYIVTKTVENRRVVNTPDELEIEWVDSLPEPDIIAIPPLEFVTRYYDGDEFVETVLEEGKYIRGFPKDVRDDVDYDPIAES